MGNLCTCFPRKPAKRRRIAATKRITNHSQPPSWLPSSSSGWSRARSSRKDKVEALTRDQAVAAAILFSRHRQDGDSAPFDRSASLRHPNLGPKKQALPRSSSSRARSLTDPLLQPHQLVNQEIKIDELETNHFILVHGGGFGAWCWYKTIALLEEGGFKVTAIDLTGSGIHLFDANGVTSLSQYVKPLTDFLEKLADGEKVILVGHDFGGACISYAMELLPSKISKAIFVAAAMLTNGQSTLDTFAKQAVRGVRSSGLENREVLLAVRLPTIGLLLALNLVRFWDENAAHRETSASLVAGTNDLMQHSQIFLYANGNDNPPTAIDLDKSLLRDLLFNRSPAKDVALASVSMRPIPFAPVLEKLRLSNKYGIVRRFYVETSEDNAITLELQESMVKANPPERVFLLRGADHSPFFSKPQGLHKILVEISRTS